MVINSKNSYPSSRTEHKGTSSLIRGGIRLQDNFEAGGPLGLEKGQGWKAFVCLANISTQHSGTLGS